MISYSDALVLSIEYIKDSDVPLQITLEGEFSEGWFFCYDSKEFVETGEFSARLAGNAPFLIDRDSGRLYTLGTAQPLEEYLSDYMREKAEKR